MAKAYGIIYDAPIECKILFLNAKLKATSILSIYLSPNNILFKNNNKTVITIRNSIELNIIKKGFLKLNIPYISKNITAKIILKNSIL